MKLKCGLRVFIGIKEGGFAKENCKITANRTQVQFQASSAPIFALCWECALVRSQLWDILANSFQ